MGAGYSVKLFISHPRDIQEHFVELWLVWGVVGDGPGHGGRVQRVLADIEGSEAVATCVLRLDLVVQVHGVLGVDFAVQGE